MCREQLDHDNDVASQLEAAMASGLYDRVDEREYFAELSEAWFWENDFQPFTRDALLTFGPVGAAVVRLRFTIGRFAGGGVVYERVGA